MYSNGFFVWDFACNRSGMAFRREKRKILGGKFGKKQKNLVFNDVKEEKSMHCLEKYEKS